MAHIKSITFQSVAVNEGCTCDRCGQHIKNIWTVQYVEGIRFNYGIDCFYKVHKAGLNATGKRQMNKIMGFIKSWQDRLVAYTNGEITADNDQGWQYMQSYEHSYWRGRPYEEYKEWTINEFIPARLAEHTKELEKFKKINFSLV